MIQNLTLAFKEIEESTSRKESNDDFKGLFDDINLYNVKFGNDEKERTNVLANIMMEINEVQFNDKKDILGDAYEYLIGNFASSAGKKGGEFYTPSEVSTVVAKIVASNNDKVENVYDPTCGSGSLLIKAYNEFKGKKSRIEMSTFKIRGQELNHTTYNLARMNMFLHGIDHDNFKILQGDTIKNDRFKNEKFDAIVANPPFRTQWEPDESGKDYLNLDPRFSKYGKLAPKSRAEYTFVQHMLEHLSDNGIMATVLPHGILFRGGSEKVIRRYIIEQENQLDAIIGLPSNLFFGTGIPAIIAVYKKCRKENEPILFIDASKRFEKVKNQNKLREEDINKIIELYVSRSEISKEDNKDLNEDQKIYSRNVSLKEIEENEYNLNITRYIDTFEEEEHRPLSEIKLDLLKIDQEIKELDEIIEKQEKELFKELGIELD